MEAEKVGATGRTYAVVSCHFGDPFWIEQLTHWLETMTPPGVIGSFRVVNQDETPEQDAHLRSLPLVTEVLRFPRCEAQVAMMGHDHPDALDRVLALPYDTTHVIVFDSDCLPVSDTWLTRVGEALDRVDVVIAAQQRWGGLSHPCFAVLPTDHLGEFDFSRGVCEVGIDTGRLVAMQAVDAGLTVDLLLPEPAFARWRGSYYLDGDIFHFGGGSYTPSTDPKIQGKIDRRQDEFFQGRVAAGRWSLSTADKAWLRCRWLLRRLRRWRRRRRTDVAR